MRVSDFLFWVNYPFKLPYRSSPPYETCCANLNLSLYNSHHILPWPCFLKPKNGFVKILSRSGYLNVIFALFSLLIRLWMELCRVLNWSQRMPAGASLSMHLSTPGITKEPVSRRFTKPTSCESHKSHSNFVAMKNFCLTSYYWQQMSCWI